MTNISTALINLQRLLLALGILVVTISGFAQAGEKTSLVQDCIAVVGDSGAYGTVIFELPGQGFAVVRTRPFSLILDDHLAAKEAIHFGIYDLSVAASSLGSETPYSASEQYRSLRSQNCRFVIIFPWINDLSNLDYMADPDRYVNTMASFIQRLVKKTPHSHVIIIGYYYMQPASFAPKAYGEGLSNDNVARFNAALFSACDLNGRLTEVGQVTCIDPNVPFAEAGLPYLMSVYTEINFPPLVFEPLDADETAFLNTYWYNNPGGYIIADGVHLSNDGKSILADALYQHFLRLDPAAMQPFMDDRTAGDLP